MTARTVLVLALLAAISPLATGMYLPGFPQMAADLSTNAATLQLTMTTFLAGLALGQLVIGPLSDRTGRRAPLLIGATVCVLASGACAVAPGIGVLIAARFLQGFAGAAGVVLGRAIVADSVRGPVAARTFSWLMTLGAVARPSHRCSAARCWGRSAGGVCSAPSPCSRWSCWSARPSRCPKAFRPPGGAPAAPCVEPGGCSPTGSISLTPSSSSSPTRC